jgi:hypothetical protein
MMARIILLILFICVQDFAIAQDLSKDYYWVQFTDKKGTPFQINHPEDFLSQRAIDRRIRQQIAFDETDLPVSPVYLDSLKNLGVEIFHTSKWLNGATLKVADTIEIDEIAALSFVKNIQLTKPAKTLKSARRKFHDELITEYDTASYGNANDQLMQLNGQYLHQKGFRGKGMHIAVLDAGFWHVDQITAFDSLRNSNRILGIRDFVSPNSNVYEEDTHGMSVLSCMGSNLPGTLIGTSPDASFYLLRTEDNASEYLVEEDNWIAGAEYADSLGVDLINSSLGYYTFNDPAMNHTYADMDGKTTRVTQGANMAFQKGILVFSSAGNEATDSWVRIIAPSDGENVIGVAAVSVDGTRASFSSIGPAYGGAVKPNVAARGALTFLIKSNGSPGNSSGTSFASPVLAGMGACLMQSNPLATVEQLKLAIEQSSSQFLTPDSLIGYGIPDFEKADQILKVNHTEHQTQTSSWAVSPNPFIDYLLIRNLKPEINENCQVSIYNLQGMCISQTNFKSSENYLLKNLAHLPEGLLILNIRSGKKSEQIKLLKLNR